MSRVASLRHTLLQGAAWMFAMRQITHVLGIVSTIVLARLLTPDDFGIVAMAGLVIGLTEVLLSLGVESAVIQKDQPSADYINTAWTLRLIQFAVVAGVVVVMAPVAAHVFEEPRLTAPLQVLGGTTLLLGLQNIGVVLLRKELQFKKDFWLMVSRRIVAFIVTIPMAIVLESYWALVIGTLLARLYLLALSYVIHEYRPRLTLCELRVLWNFSQWMIVRSVGAYARDAGDEVVTGIIGSTAMLGAYNLARQAGDLPGGNLVAPLERALFPGFSKLQNEPGRLQAAYLRVLTVVAAVAVPVTVGLALVAEDAVVFLFGEKWLEAAVFLPPLAMTGMFACLQQTALLCLLALGRVRLTALMVWGQVGIFGVLAIPLAWTIGPLGLAVAKMFAMAAIGVWVWIAISAELAISREKWVAAVGRPMLAAAAMAGAVLLTAQHGAGGFTGHAGLAVKVAVGAVVYTGASLLLWRAQGRPDGLEQLVFGMLKALRERARRAG